MGSHDAWPSGWTSNVNSKAAHDLLDTAVSGCYTSAASEVSMLFMLYQMGSAGGPYFVLGGEGRSRRTPGSSAAWVRSISRSPPSSATRSSCRSRSACITQDSDGVTVAIRTATACGPGTSIVAVPLAIASQIIYEPMLPTDRSFLHQRMPSGAIVKISVVYDEPFWRADGLCGQSAAPGSLATVTIDACTDTGTPGILCVIIEGPIARQYERLDEAERRQAVLDALVERFGDKAAQARRLRRAELDPRAVFRRRDAQPRAARCAHRVRPCAARTVRPHPLGRHRELGDDVRLDRRRDPLRRTGRQRSYGQRGRAGSRLTVLPRCLLHELHARSDAKFGVDVRQVCLHGPG